MTQDDLDLIESEIAFHNAEIAILEKKKQELLNQ